MKQTPRLQFLKTEDSRMVAMGYKPRSNFPIVLTLWVLMFVGLYLTDYFQEWYPWVGDAAVALFSFPFLGFAMAQLYSGYLWQNLAPGSRGLHRSESPKRFLVSTVSLFLIASGFIVLAVWRCMHPR